MRPHRTWPGRLEARSQDRLRGPGFGGSAQHDHDGSDRSDPDDGKARPGEARPSDARPAKHGLLARLRARLSRLALGTARRMSSSLTRRIVFLNLAGLAVTAVRLHVSQPASRRPHRRAGPGVEHPGRVIAGPSRPRRPSRTTSSRSTPRSSSSSMPARAPTATRTTRPPQFSINPEQVAPLLAPRRHPIPHARPDLRSRRLASARHAHAHGRERHPARGPAPAMRGEAAFPGAPLGLAHRLASSSRRCAAPRRPRLNGKVGREVDDRACRSHLEPRRPQSRRRDHRLGRRADPALPHRCAACCCFRRKAATSTRMVSDERIGLLRVFLVAAIVMTVLSFLLAGTIAGPVRRLAEAAERVRRGIKSRQEIPDFTNRPDEIGHLSGALRDMTQRALPTHGCHRELRRRCRSRAEEPADLAAQRRRDAAARPHPTIPARA